MKPYAFVICTDNNYVAHAGTCLFSLLLSTPRRDFDIHVIGVELSTEDTNRLYSLAHTFNVRVEIHDGAHMLSVFRDINKNHDRHRSAHISDSCLLRLTYADIIKQVYNKIAYIDCDVIFQQDACKILDHDLGEFSIGATLDLVINKLKKTDSKSTYPYFNAGILLIRDQLWRDRGEQGLLLDILKRADPKDLPFPDQDILNHHFRDQGYSQLPWEFNYQFMATENAILEPNEIPLKNAIAIHFAGEIKPWHEWAPREHAEIYEKYRLVSPWSHNYKPQQPTSMKQLKVGFQALKNQKRFEEACKYGNTIIRILQKNKSV